MHVFIMRGASNSGKDYFCDRNFAKHCVLSSDEIRLILMNNANDQTQNKRVFDHLRLVLDTRLSMGCEYTVVNATNLKFRDTRPYLDIAKQYGAYVTYIDILPPSLDTLKTRRDLRASNGGLFVPDHVLERHYHQYHECMAPFITESDSNEFVEFVRVNSDWKGMLRDDKNIE